MKEKTQSGFRKPTLHIDNPATGDEDMHYKTVFVEANPPNSNTKPPTSGIQDAYESVSSDNSDPSEPKKGGRLAALLAAKRARPSISVTTSSPTNSTSSNPLQNCTNSSSSSLSDNRSEVKRALRFSNITHEIEIPALSPSPLTSTASPSSLSNSSSEEQLHSESDDEEMGYNNSNSDEIGRHPNNDRGVESSNKNIRTEFERSRFRARDDDDALYSHLHHSAVKLKVTKANRRRLFSSTAAGADGKIVPAPFEINRRDGMMTEADEDDYYNEEMAQFFDRNQISPVSSFKRRCKDYNPSAYEEKCKIAPREQTLRRVLSDETLREAYKESIATNAFHSPESELSSTTTAESGGPLDVRSPSEDSPSVQSEEENNTDTVVIDGPPEKLKEVLTQQQNEIEKLAMQLASLELTKHVHMLLDVAVYHVKPFFFLSLLGGGIPVSAPILFKALLHWNAFDSQAYPSKFTAATAAAAAATPTSKTASFLPNEDLLFKVTAAIQKVAQRNCNDNSVLAYWLSCCSFLVKLTKAELKTRTPRHHHRDQFLPANDLWTEVDPDMPAHLFLEELVTIRDTITNNLLNNLFNEIKGSLLLSFLGDPAIEIHKNTAIQFVIDKLDFFARQLKENYVPKFIVKKFFSQLFYMINVHVFNYLMSIQLDKPRSKKHQQNWSISVGTGLNLKMAVAEIDQWIHENLTNLSGTKKYLAHLREAGNVLSIDKRVLQSAEMRTRICASLNSMQFTHLMVNFAADSYDPDPKFPPFFENLNPAHTQQIIEENESLLSLSSLNFHMLRVSSDFSDTKFDLSSSSSLSSISNRSALSNGNNSSGKYLDLNFEAIFRLNGEYSVTEDDDEDDDEEDFNFSSNIYGEGVSTVVSPTSDQISTMKTATMTTTTRTTLSTSHLYNIVMDWYQRDKDNCPLDALKEIGLIPRTNNHNANLTRRSLTRNNSSAVAAPTAAVVLHTLVENGDDGSMSSDSETITTDNQINLQPPSSSMLMSAARISDENDSYW